MTKTAIWVSHELKNELKDIGKKGETYEDVIWRLIRYYYKGKEGENGAGGSS